MLRRKTHDFIKSHEDLNSRYERKLMQSEDFLALESAKSKEIIMTKNRELDAKKILIRDLESEVDKAKSESRQLKKDLVEANNNLKNLHLDLKLAQKDLKLKEEKISDLRRETQALQKEKVDKVESIKNLQ